MNETKTPSKIKNSEETENDEDDDALKHVNLFSKYQNRSLKFGDGTFLSRTEKRRLRRKRTHEQNTPEMSWRHHHSLRLIFPRQRMIFFLDYLLIY